MSKAQRHYNGLSTYGAPAAYRVYSNPYNNNTTGKNNTGTPAKAVFQILTNTLADFDGQTIQTTVIDENGSTSFTLTFDDDAPPPSTSSTIKIQGLTTQAQIAAQLASSFELRGFRTVVNGAKVTVYQPIAGDSGNQQITPAAALNDNITVNGTAADSTREVFFYGGFTFDVPMSLGPRKAFGPGPASPKFLDV